MIVGEKIVSMELLVHPIKKWLGDSHMKNQSNKKTFYIPDRKMLKKGKHIAGHGGN